MYAIIKGLACNKIYELKHGGEAYTIASTVCENGKYMNNELCPWYFAVKDCKPSISCNKFHIKGKEVTVKLGKRGKRNWKTRKQYENDILFTL